VTMGTVMTNICIAGVTGWVGAPLAQAVLEAEDLTLSGAVARSAAGRRVEGSDLTIAGSVAEALESASHTDVLIDYTAPQAVRGHIEEALRHGVGVVVGTSGLTAEDYAQVDALARELGVGVIASGNFSVMVAVLQHAALLAAERLSAWEVLDYASDGKPDAPSGTARELAERLSAVRRPAPTPDPIGPAESRGASLNGTRVHSLRLPSFTVSTEVVFGGEDERLSLRHDAGNAAAPYISGTLLAARLVTERVGVTRGLDQLLFG
jgi:4-hydroxy-tetrahydrodipicolinate reductase